MSELYELLEPDLQATDSSSNPRSISYLNRICSLSLSDLTSTEPASLLHAAQSHLRNLQALSRRSHKAVIVSSSHLSQLGPVVPAIKEQTKELQEWMPSLESAAATFAAKYDRSVENEVLERRKQAMLLARNVDRVTDVLELPALLSSTIAAGQVSTSTSTSNASTATSYSSALDLNAHIRRLQSLYPRSHLVSDISRQAETETANLITILIGTLQSPTLKLASAMRTISWLQRLAPDLSGARAVSFTPDQTWDDRTDHASEQSAMGSLFLVCRMRFLRKNLDALEPLRHLADQETMRRQSASTTAKPAPAMTSLGSQSERYIKRYIEIFREQSFNITSMYKSIFPTGLPTDQEDRSDDDKVNAADSGLSLTSPISSFAMYLVDLLISMLREYLPNVTEKSARESLLTQTLYAASSLGRLGADFSLMLAVLEEELRGDQEGDVPIPVDAHDLEWVQVMQKHRVQASRLEVLARGVGGSGKKANTAVLSPDTVLSTA